MREVLLYVFVTSSFATIEKIYEFDLYWFHDDKN